MLRLTNRAELLLSRYPWPGNVRELENAIDYACMMTQLNTIDVHDFPEKPQEIQAPLGEISDAPVATLAEIERQYILQVLDRFQGNKRLAAEALGIGRSSMYRLLDKNPA